MHALDTTMAAICANKSKAFRILEDLGFDPSQGHLLSSSLPPLVDALAKKGYSRRQISSKLVTLISELSVEDATLYVYAALIYARSSFDFADCATLAYCYSNDVYPTFGNDALMKAYEERTYAYDPSTFDEED